VEYGWIFLRVTPAYFGAGSDEFREPGKLKMQLLKTPPEIVQSKDFWLLTVLVDA